jgi:hypothetical protein
VQRKVQLVQNDQKVRRAKERMEERQKVKEMLDP